MYYLLAILLGLVALSILLPRLRFIPPLPARGAFDGKARYAHRCATATLQAVRKDFATWARGSGESPAVVTYPSWVIEYVAG